jgi:Rod binding domain-containing protein
MADSLPAIGPTTGLGIGSLDGNKNSPEKIKSAASQFEALLISQVMKAAHEGEDDADGWLGTGEDQTAQSLMGMADEFFARAVASRGGFGLAQTVAQGLDQRERQATQTDGLSHAATPE